MEIPTNGLLNRTDMLWAQRANPAAHAAQVYRDQQDIKMLQKKKKSRELSSNLWAQKSGKKNSGVRTAQTSKNGMTKSLENQKSTKSMRSVGFSPDV